MAGLFDTLQVGGGYGDTGLSVDASGNLTANGNATIDGTLSIAGGYGATGLGIDASGNLSADGTIIGKTKLQGGEQGTKNGTLQLCGAGDGTGGKAYWYFGNGSNTYSAYLIQYITNNSIVGRVGGGSVGTKNLWVYDAAAETWSLYDPITFSDNVTISGTLSVAGGYGSTGLSVDSSGNLTADGNGTFDGSLIVGDGTSYNRITVNGAAAQNRGMVLQTNGSARWQLMANNTAESGANAGSNYTISRYDDAGSFLETALTIVRSSGQLNLTQGLTVAGGYGSTGLSVTTAGNLSTNGTGQFDGNVTIGVADTTQGKVLLQGGSSTEGGQVSWYFGAANDDYSDVFYIYCDAEDVKCRVYGGSVGSKDLWRYESDNELWRWYDPMYFSDIVNIAAALTTTGVITAGSGAHPITTAAGYVDGGQILAGSVTPTQMNSTGSYSFGSIAITSGTVTFGADGVDRGYLTLWDGADGNKPGAIKICSPNGTAWYVFVEDDGTLKVHNALPTQNSDGSVVGAQT